MSYNYNPLWKTMEKKGISQYRLLKENAIDTKGLYNIRNGKNITLRTLDRLCQVLECSLDDIVEIIHDEKK